MSEQKPVSETTTGDTIKVGDRTLTAKEVGELLEKERTLTSVRESLERALRSGDSMALVELLTAAGYDEDAAINAVLSSIRAGAERYDDENDEEEEKDEYEDEEEEEEEEEEDEDVEDVANEEQTGERAPATRAKADEDAQWGVQAWLKHMFDSAVDEALAKSKLLEKYTALIDAREKNPKDAEASKRLVREEVIRDFRNIADYALQDRIAKEGVAAFKADPARAIRETVLNVVPMMENIARRRYGNPNAIGARHTPLGETEQWLESARERKVGFNPEPGEDIVTSTTKFQDAFTRAVLEEAYNPGDNKV